MSNVGMSLDDLMKAKASKAKPATGRGRAAGAGKSRGGAGRGRASRGRASRGMRGRGSTAGRGRGRAEYEVYNEQPAYLKQPKSAGFKTQAARASAATSAVAATSKLLVSNLNPDTVTNDDIQELFGAIGSIHSARLHFDENKRSLGTATVTYKNKADALKAVEKYNDVPLDDKPMRIDLIATPVTHPAAQQQVVQQPRARYVEPEPRYQRAPAQYDAPYRGRGGRGTRGRGAGGRGGRGTRGRGGGRGGRGRGSSEPAASAADSDNAFDAFMKGKAEA